MSLPVEFDRRRWQAIAQIDRVLKQGELADARFERDYWKGRADHWRTKATSLYFRALAAEAGREWVGAVDRGAVFAAEAAHDLGVPPVSLAGTGPCEPRP